MKALSAHQICKTFEDDLLALVDKAHSISHVLMETDPNSVALRIEAMADLADLTQSAGVFVVGAQALFGANQKLKGATDALACVHCLYRVVLADIADAIIRLNKA